MTDVQQVETSRLKTLKRVQQQPEQPDVISFEEAVAEGKRIVAEGESNAWRLAEIAGQVEPRYGDKTLTKLAKEIGGIAACTLVRRRSVYLKWKKIPAAPPKLFSVAQELADHPDAARIIRDNPNITSREARKLTRENNKQKKQEDPGYKKWFQDAVEHANVVECDAEIVDDKLSPERRKTLLEAIEPNLLPDLLDGGNALIKLHNFLQRLVKEASRDAADDAQAT